MKHTRERVAHELRSRLADIFQLKIADPRLRGLRVSEVRPSPDLSFARVFYVSSGADQEVAAALASAKPFIRRCLAQATQMRRVPELDFRADPSLDQAARIDEILRGLSSDPDPDPAPGGGDVQ